MKTVAFQGEPGAYSESAVYQFFGSKVRAKPCRDFRDVFEAVKLGEVVAGAVPGGESLAVKVASTKTTIYSSIMT